MADSRLGGNVQNKPIFRQTFDANDDILPSQEHTSTPVDAGNLARDISWDEVAAKLLRDRYLLTALELHAELSEGGRELTRLRDYFSNPGNFDRPADFRELSPGLPRTTSIQTFDSLDFARFSDDGDRQSDERVAVLEFELRKAKETIKSLRANLTEAAESEVATPDSHLDNPVADETIKPHEKRAINFLVNEYLLKYNYKLTAITFSDENDDQDFEDWDDVGLNIPKPPSLLVLHRDHSRHSHGAETCLTDSASQTTLVAFETTTSLDCPKNIDNPHSEDVVASAVCPSCGSSIGSGSRELETSPSRLRRQTQEQPQSSAFHHSPNAFSSTHAANRDELQSGVTRNISTSAESSHRSDDLKCFGVGDTVATGREDPSRMDTSTVGSANSTLADDDDDEADDKLDEPADSPERGPASAVLRTDDSFDDADFYAGIQRPELVGCSPLASALKHNIHSLRKSTPQSFHRLLIESCRTQKMSLDNRLAIEVAEISDSSEKVVLMLARCLPHIVPNVILAKREELIPLILCTISLHPDLKDRDKLLNILFNLIKRPDDDQREMILTGFLTIAEHLGPTRVEGELLPQCWEQISHKYPERRLLVAEACGVLIPYVPNEIRSSLVLSMLQQMLIDDKTDFVREAVVKSLSSLLLFIDDADKYSLGLHLLITALGDSSEKVVKAALNSMLPALAAWAKDLEKLDTDLFSGLTKILQDKIRDFSEVSSQQQQQQGPTSAVSAEEQAIINLISALESLLPWLLISLLEAMPMDDTRDDSISVSDALDASRFPPNISSLCGLDLIAGDEARVTALLNRFEAHISEEWYESWKKLDFLTKNIIPNLVGMLTLLGLSSQPIIHVMSQLFYWICRTFGRQFTNSKVKPVFQAVLRVPGDDLESLLGKIAVTQSIVPVYVAGVLTAFTQDEDRLELNNFFEELLTTLSLCHLPMDSICVTITVLKCNATYHDFLLKALWDGVGHTSALVRCSAARLFELLVGHVSDNLLALKVTPALVTLASDPEISVLIATVSTFGTLIETTTNKSILAKSQMQLQSFLDDPMYKDQYSLHTEIIRTFGRISPNAEPKFRDEFVLPHLVALASHNNHVINNSKRTEVAYALLEAFGTMTCCFLHEQLICELLLPGLRCLLYDVQQLVPDQEESVVAMIHDYESKVEAMRPQQERSNSVSSPGSASASMEDVKNRMTKIFTTKSNTGKSNIQNIFQLRKK